MPVDFELSGYRSSERDHLQRMLDSLHERDLLILDRGYPSHAVIQDLHSRGIDFLIRVPSSQTFKAIDEFRASGATDGLVTIHPPSPCDNDWESLSLRVVRNETPDGPTFFLTSLTSEEADTTDIVDLYHLRWQVEEYFKVFTGQYIGQGLFRSTMPLGIRQEFGALTVLYAMSRVLAAQANEAVGDPDAVSVRRAHLESDRKLCEP